MPPEQQQRPETVNDQLDHILYLLDRMNRRDRLRTIGGFFRGLISIIPIAIVVWSSWYFVAHSDDIIKKITSMVSEQALSASRDDAQKLIQQMQSQRNGQ